MRALPLVEARRLLARRIVRFTGAMVVLGLLIAGLVLFVRSHPFGPGSAAQQAAARQAEQDRQVAECMKRLRPSDVPAGRTVEEVCNEVVFVPSVPNPEFHLTHYREVSGGLAGLFIALLVVLGATSAGAEWHAGTITTQLTWEPRRARLFLAKVGVAAVFGFVAFLAAEALLFLALAPAAVFRGSTIGVDATWARETIQLLLRAAVVAAIGAAIGHALAWLARNTAVAVGGALGYAAVVEPLLRAAKPKWEPWFLVSNAIRFVTAHPLDFTTRTRSTVGAALLLVAYAAGAAVVSLVVFARRDVT